MCPSSKTKVQHSFDLVKQSFLQEVLAAHSAQFDQISKPIVLVWKTPHWLCSFGHCDYYECKGLGFRVSPTKTIKCSSVACNWIALASFSAPTWGKSLKCLGLSFSFTGVLWGLVWWLFVGAGMEGPFFAPGPVAQWERPCHWCARRRCFITVYKDWRLESSLVRVYFGAQVFSGVVLWS